MHYTAEALIEALRQRLSAALAPLQLEISDDSHHHAGHAGARGGGRHLRVLIVATAFAGKPTVARHRLVYAAAGDLMLGPIHALMLTTHTPDESR